MSILSSFPWAWRVGLLSQAFIAAKRWRCGHSSTRDKVLLAGFVSDSKKVQGIGAVSIFQMSNVAACGAGLSCLLGGEWPRRGHR